MEAKASARESGQVDVTRERNEAARNNAFFAFVSVFEVHDRRERMKRLQATQAWKVIRCSIVCQHYAKFGVMTEKRRQRSVQWARRGQERTGEPTFRAELFCWLPVRLCAVSVVRVCAFTLLLPCKYVATCRMLARASSCMMLLLFLRCVCGNSYLV